MLKSISLGFFCLLLVLTGFQNLEAKPNQINPPNKPEVVAEQFLKALLVMDLSAASNFACNATKETLSFMGTMIDAQKSEMSEDELANFDSELKQLAATKIEIKTCRVEGKSCECQVEVCRPGAECEINPINLIFEDQEWRVSLEEGSQEEE